MARRSVLRRAGQAVRNNLGLAGGLAGASFVTIAISLSVGSVMTYVSYHIGEWLLSLVGLAIWS